MYIVHVCSGQIQQITELWQSYLTEHVSGRNSSLSIYDFVFG